MAALGVDDEEPVDVLERIEADLLEFPRGDLAALNRLLDQVEIVLLEQGRSDQRTHIQDDDAIAVIEQILVGRGGAGGTGQEQHDHQGREVKADRRHGASSEKERRLERED